MTSLLSRRQNNQRVVLHIGSTKTGSSFLQYVLHLNRDKLLKHGILYPDVGTRSSAHHLIATCVHPTSHRLHPDVDWSDKKGLLNHYVQEIRRQQKATGAKTLIISSEYLWRILPGPNLEQLAALFGESTVEIVCFLRNQMEWIPSTYGQAVKYGETKRYEDWLDQKLKGPQFPANYSLILQHFANTFDRPSIKALDYDLARSSGGVCKAFFQRLELEVNTLSLKLPAKKVNPSLGATGTALFRQVNKIPLPKAQKKYILGTLLKLPDNKNPINLMTADQRKRIEEVFSAQNMQLEKYFDTSQAPPWVKNGR